MEAIKADIDLAKKTLDQVNMELKEARRGKNDDELGENNDLSKAMEMEALKVEIFMTKENLT